MAEPDRRRRHSTSGARRGRRGWREWGNVRAFFVLTASLAALAAAPLGARAAPQPITYDVPQPADHARLSQGWGLFATMNGRSTDIGARDMQWSDDPGVQPHDVEAGYGWRKGAATAVFGYDEHDFGPKYDAASVRDMKDPDAPRVGDSGVLGLSLVLHAP
jgi:hypothetical protein